MLPMLLACTLLLVLATLTHYEALRLLGAVLPRLRKASRARLILVIFGSFAAHTLEIAIYALACYALVRWSGVGTLGDGTEPSLAMSLYFSAETYTSLGYGDIVPQGPLRMLAGVEALNGLLLIGWSASYIHVSMERFWAAELR
jgi:voltage-gated potassium channel Kch